MRGEWRVESGEWRVECGGVLMKKVNGGDVKSAARPHS